MSAGPSSARPMSLKRTIRLFVFFYDQVIEFLCRVHQSHGADGQLDGVSFNTARGEFDVFVVYRILYVDGGDAVTGHLDRVEPQAHGVAFFSPNAYAAHIGDCLQLLFYGEVGYFAEFQQERLSLCKATIRIGMASASAFDTVGGSQSRGR